MLSVRFLFIFVVMISFLEVRVWASSCKKPVLVEQSPSLGVTTESLQTPSEILPTVSPPYADEGIQRKTVRFHDVVRIIEFEAVQFHETRTPIGARIPSEVIVSKSEPALGLQTSVETLENEIEQGSCEPGQTLFVYAINGTVLQRLPFRGSTLGRSFAIHNSRQLLQRVSRLNVNRVALTSSPYLDMNILGSTLDQETHRSLEDILVQDTWAGGFVSNHLDVLNQFREAELKPYLQKVPTFSELPQFRDQKGLPTQDGFFTLDSNLTDRIFGEVLFNARYPNDYRSRLLQKVKFSSDGIIYAALDSKSKVLRHWLRLVGRYFPDSPKKIHCLFYVDANSSDVQSMALTFRKTRGIRVYLFPLATAQSSTGTF